jgi:hypothetical protein
VRAGSVCSAAQAERNRLSRGTTGRGLKKLRTASARLAKRVLVMSSKAGSMTPEIEAKLRKAFADSLVLEFDPKQDFRRIADRAGSSFALLQRTRASQ